jgi:hypothetical protein
MNRRVNFHIFLSCPGPILGGPVGPMHALAVMNGDNLIRAGLDLLGPRDPRPSLTDSQ